MQKNVFCTVEYVGTNYFGFQLQNKKGKSEPTVQEFIETALKKLFKKDIRIIYASRTDRGVHAKEQVINFKIDTNIPLKNIKKALNSFLPKDIYVRKIKTVPLNFHSRFCAKSKIYRYVIFNRNQPSVFYRNFSWHIDRPLDIKKMKEAVSFLIGKKDFSIFAKDVKNYKDCTREIKNIWIKKQNSFIYIDIEADGFLRNMARNIVGFLVKVGEGKIKISDIVYILEKKLKYINKPAPSCGLYLRKVKYSYDL
ncbi:MAG: tRNA pseudouridine(38-40) synthase TruA [Candidatus Omnitrophica bacterium]|nr:tRNA pseudouridine(38-40) synthase TruA [Candidatus Omnitrophota bacterium]